MGRPWLLDLFCGAGGAGVGYARAGFAVVGVDIAPQPNYPYAFIQGDALEYLAAHSAEFDAIHASPPCQRYSAMSVCRPGLDATYPDLVAPTRVALEHAGRPWVIENVPGAPMRADATLCGHTFGLELYRHRLFESSVPLAALEHLAHVKPGSRAGHWQPGQIISVSGHCAPMAVARAAMGIEWMTRAELAEAIPPVYTQWVGGQLLRALEA